MIVRVATSGGATRSDWIKTGSNWINWIKKKKNLSIWMFHEKINFKFLKMSKNRNFESKTDSTESTGSNWIKLDQKLDQTGSSFLIWIWVKFDLNLFWMVFQHLSKGKPAFTSKIRRGRLEPVDACRPSAELVLAHLSIVWHRVFACRAVGWYRGHLLLCFRRSAQCRYSSNQLWQPATVKDPGFWVFQH